MKYLIPLLILAACSSKPDKAPRKEIQVRNEDFKKEKPITSAQISDYYQTSAKSKNPALQDETLDRMSGDEFSSVNASADPLLDISIRCMKRDFENAFAIAAKNFNKYQKVAPYWNQVANCHLNQGSYRKALLFYNKALEVKPGYVPALNNIGVMYSRQGQDQKALVAFERANAQSRFSKTPRYNLATLYQTYGMADSALPIFESLLNESPTDVDLLNSVASAHFILSNYPQALAHFERIPKSEWKRPEIGLNLAMTLKKSGKASEANDVFDEINKPTGSALKRYYSVIKNQLGDAE